MRWVGGMRANPDPRMVGLYNRARICQTFPAYKLHELRDVPAAEILQAMRLLSLAAQVQ